MQMDAARRLRETVGPCQDTTHKWEKEYFNSTNTGDYVCSVCGAEISGLSYEQLRKKQAESTQ